MLEVVIFCVVGLVPWVLGYASGRYWAALLPGAILGAAILNLARSEPSQVSDEVDVWPGVLTVLFAIAVLVCLAGAKMRRMKR